MSDAPERIWADNDGDWHSHDYSEVRPCTEYIRADRIAQLERDLAEARAERDEAERLKCVWFETHIAHHDANQALGNANGKLLQRAMDAERRAEAAEAERDRLAAELRNDQAELKRLMRAVPGAHFCQDWDGLLVWPGTPEADACTCASLQTGEQQQP